MHTSGPVPSSVPAFWSASAPATDAALAGSTERPIPPSSAAASMISESDTPIARPPLSRSARRAWPPVSASLIDSAGERCVSTLGTSVAFRRLGGDERCRALGLASIQTRQPVRACRADELAPAFVDSVQAVSAANRDEHVRSRRPFRAELLRDLEGNGFVALDAVRIRHGNGQWVVAGYQPASTSLLSSRALSAGGTATGRPPTWRMPSTCAARRLLVRQHHTLQTSPSRVRGPARPWLPVDWHTMRVNPSVAAAEIATA